MASNSKRWASIISRFATRIYFFLIVFQIPLFRFPCRMGVCRTPIEVTSCQLIANEIFPTFVVKTLLYPGAIAKSILKKRPIPTYSNILNIYKLKNFKPVPATTDLHHLEVLAGSYFSVAGAFLGLLESGRVSLFGILLVIWGLAKEILIGKQEHTFKDHKETIYIYYPTLAIALLSAFLSVRGDVRRILRTRKTYPKAKYT